MDSIYYWSAERQYSNVDDIRMALEDGEIQGALIDTYVIAEHKESLLSDRIFVKKYSIGHLVMGLCFQELQGM